MNIPTRRYAPEARLVLLAAVFLSLGVLVYVFGRSTPAHFLPVWLAPMPANAVTAIGGSVPAFAHTFAMILITAAILRPWPRTLAPNCMAWCALECCFEAGQMAPVDSQIAAALPEWTSRVPVLDLAGDFFIVGTFDYLDIAASALGAFIAYFVVHKIYQGEKP